MPNIELKNVEKKFTSINDDDKKEVITAVDNVSLKVKRHSYNALLGPSGCGKTTLLRIISGLEHPTEGKVFFDGIDVTNICPEERNIGFVFQDYSLFPHMDVWHNVSYGPMVRNFSEEATNRIVSEVLKIVKLYDRLNAYPSELSGGMQQRAAVARALATRSNLMLLDEPLGALDARIGTALRYDLMKLVKKYRLTAIHVTHNQEEAMTISDNIIIMKRGRIIQSGTPGEIYNNPNSIFSAYFLGRCNFLRCKREDDRHVRFQNAVIELSKDNKKERVIIGVRPEKVYIDRSLGKRNVLGIVEFVNFLGSKWQYIVKVSDGTEISVLGEIPVNIAIGQKVSISFQSEDVFIFDEPDNFEEEKSV